MKYYAGIGSRKTPEPVLLLMEHIALKLEAKGYRCRTGGAPGADMAFFYGASPNVDVFLPWEGFNGFKFKGVVCGDDPTLRAIAESHHPAWNRLTPSEQLLMSRNVAQIIGCDSGDVRSEFVICWTPEGKGGGGTGHVIRVAAAYGVPVYDLALKEARDKVKEMCR